MQSRKRNIVSRIIGATLCVASMNFAFSSCEKIYEDLDPCAHGVSLRFIYDYNMEFANAFPKKVDCLTLYIYDEEGNHVGTRVVTGPELRDEGFRMTLDLEPGNYRFVAYGGIACGKSSFSMVRTPESGCKYSDVRAKMDVDCLTNPDRKKLHDMYWGQLTLATADLYQEGVVEMMKNTNNIRIVLQQMNGEPVDDKDFDFEITDDNTLFACDNDLIPNGVETYTPWARGQASTGVMEGSKEVIEAYAEFSTSRLMLKNSPKLVIRRKDGEEVVNIPLNNYLLLFRSEFHKDMDKQEFLDRRSEWSMLFFLDEDHTWLKTKIKINDWTVRINDAEI
ncbi:MULTISPECIES: FimB/Mfa2 family fimbrial subunit [Butyricimonas]|uniref:FimB/Mfa2 family fimbrial subunit n=1 Tax=Butyricimonas TaxID=574697 RepID=UPI001D08AB46|nr:MULTISPECIES: FimB/Mfa2 family fimbrial subunit [Butyricimonas]MCB6973921.1 FimB/Mfa2 family fimbrial subunit [Butyricimonas synergistica]MCG4520736.1 FimB/Mfa2 family fimbrial subunit [Butyricimonas sp. DFI.6.44]